MKMTKKKIFALSLIVCAIAIVSMGTLAWFTAQDEVTNKFMVGDSLTEPDKVFGIDVWEEIDHDRNGTVTVVGEGNNEENTLTYDFILPGEVMTKKPYLTNTGVHPQFVRAIVTVTPASTLKDAMGDDWKKAELFLAGNVPADWKLDSLSYSNDGTESKFVYVYYYQDVLEAGKTTEAIFDAVVIPTALTTDQAVQMEGFSVNVVGQAIQSEHLADSTTPGAMITTAKEAFETYWNGVPVYVGASDLYYSGDFDAPIVTPENQEYTMMYLEDATVEGEAAVKGVETVATIWLANVEGTVDNAVIIDKPNTIIIENSDFTLPTGGKLIVDNSGDTTTQIILYNVTVNGVLLDSTNIDQYVDTLGYVDFYTE